MPTYKKEIALFDLHRQKFDNVTRNYIELTESELRWVTTFLSLDAKEEADDKDDLNPDFWEDEQTWYDEIETIIRGFVSGTRCGYQVKNDCYILYINQVGAPTDIKLWFKKKEEAMEVNRIILDWSISGIVPEQK